jgi:hypothetical protein
VLFKGRDYNGTINFHGDARIAKIREFIQLVDEADNYRDVLRPSATFEDRTLPNGMQVKPKFALAGYEDTVQGFYLYHD